MGHIFGFITCTRVKWEATVAEYAEMTRQTEAEVRKEWEGDSDYDSESDTIRLEDPMEEHGWIDQSWSSRVLHDSRNDVQPVVSVDEKHREDLEDDVWGVLDWLEGGYEDNGDGTFYASESYQPYDEPWHYSYAVHFTKKECVNGVWRETPWHPVKDGGIEL